MRQKFVLVVWCCMVYLSSEVYALSCAAPKLNENIIKDSAAIFEGVAGKKHGLTWMQKTAVMMNTLTGRGGDIAKLSVYDFTVTRSWKGTAAGQNVSILFNTSWGDNYLSGGEFLIVSPQQVGDMFWTPLCGNSIDLAWARKNGDTALLENTIGIGR